MGTLVIHVGAGSSLLDPTNSACKVNQDAPFAWVEISDSFMARKGGPDRPRTRRNNATFGTRVSLGWIDPCGNDVTPDDLLKCLITQQENLCLSCLCNFSSSSSPSCPPPIPPPPQASHPPSGKASPRRTNPTNGTTGGTILGCSNECPTYWGDPVSNRRLCPI